LIARLNRSAGTAALVAAVGWLVILVAFLVLSADGLVPWETVYALLMAGGLIVGLATLIALNGMLARVAGARDKWRIGALVLAVLGVGVLASLTWFNPAWSGLLSAASLITMYRLHAAGLGSKVGLWAFALAWPLSFGLFVLLDAMEFGRIDEYGDYPWAGGIGVAVWCGLFALGLAMHVKWLRAGDGAAVA